MLTTTVVIGEVVMMHVHEGVAGVCVCVYARVSFFFFLGGG